jgi:hypothetical protein
MLSEVFGVLFFYFRGFFCFMVETFENQHFVFFPIFAGELFPVRFV